MTDTDSWNPKLYNTFRSERAQPFNDLVSMIKPDDLYHVVDLGCGTGELTAKLHSLVEAKLTIGVDSSSNMIDQAKAFENDKLKFKYADILNVNDNESYDLVFSHAALQWVENHKALFPRIISLVKGNGQVAIQMPNNQDHITHLVAAKVSQSYFPNIAPRKNNLLNLDEYSSMLFDHGFKEQCCLTKVYGHYLSSVDELVEWCKGTLLTYYSNYLSSQQYTEFLSIFYDKMLDYVGTGNYFYPFKRMLIWGRRTI